MPRPCGSPVRRRVAGEIQTSRRGDRWTTCLQSRAPSSRASVGSARRRPRGSTRVSAFVRWFRRRRTRPSLPRSGVPAVPRRLDLDAPRRGVLALGRRWVDIPASRQRSSRRNAHARAARSGNPAISHLAIRELLIADPFGQGAAAADRAARTRTASCDGWMATSYGNRISQIRQARTGPQHWCCGPVRQLR